MSWQGVAWALAARALTRSLVGQAEGAIREATKATDLSDVHAALQVRPACYVL